MSWTTSTTCTEGASGPPVFWWGKKEAIRKWIAKPEAASVFLHVTRREMRKLKPAKGNCKTENGKGGCMMMIPINVKAEQRLALRPISKFMLSEAGQT